MYNASQVIYANKLKDCGKALNMPKNLFYQVFNTKKNRGKMRKAASWEMQSG